MNIKTALLDSTAVATADGPTSDSKMIDQLQSFYRGELAAVETYERALAAASFAGVADVLRSVQASHQKRVTLLADQLRDLEAEVPASSGVWGAMVRILEEAAVTLSEKVAIGILEEGEDHGLKDYREGIEALDAVHQRLVHEELLPAQMETHRQMSHLKQAVTDGA